MSKPLTAVAVTGLILLSGCGEDNDFCSSLEKINERYDPQDPGSVQGDVEAVEPPEEIAEDWAVVVEHWGFDPEAAAAELDEADLEGAEEFMQQAEELNAAVRNVHGYARTECDIAVQFE